MRGNDEPMPLSELPDYMRSARENGQGDYVPVVDMGRIEEPRRPLRWAALAGGLLVMFSSLSMLMYSRAATRNISIVAAGDLGPEAIADIIKDEGGRVMSVKKSDEGYEFRVFTFRGIGSFLEGIRKNKEVESADLAE